MPSAEETAKTIKRLLREEPFDVSDPSKATNAGERRDAARLDELRRVLTGAVRRGDVLLDDDAREAATDARRAYDAWLRDKRNGLVRQLCDRVVTGRRYALRTLCGVAAGWPARAKGDHPNDALVLDEGTASAIVESLCVRRRPPYAADETCLRLWRTELVDPYLDARYFALSAVSALALRLSSGASKEHRRRSDEEKRAIADNLLRVLVLLDVPDDANELLDDERFLVTPPRTNTSRTKEDADKSKDDDDDDADDVKEEEEDHDDGLSDDEDTDGQDSDEETDSDCDDRDASKRSAAADSRKRKRRVDPASTLTDDLGRRRRRRRADAPFFLRSLSRHRRVLADAWMHTLALLPTSSPAYRSLHRRALRHLPDRVLPKMTNPLRTADYFVRLYDDNVPADDGRVVDPLAALLALRGLLVLVTEHGLERPRLYADLYALCRPDALYSKHRARLLELLDLCLSSTMLPAYAVAAFTKRLCRTALDAPPAGALAALALTSDALRRHGECACLVQRDRDVLVDGHDAETDDPALANALGSSLWELDALANHACPAVAVLAEACGREDERAAPPRDAAEYASHTYESLFDRERRRRVSGPTPTEHRAPTDGLFAPDDVFANVLSWPTTTTTTTTTTT